MNQASCGHKISSNWMFSNEGLISVKNYDRNGDRTVDYMLACSECKSQLRKLGKILETERACQEWLKGN